MYLRRCWRQKDGKRHAYWALVESYRTVRGPRQRVVAYLGEMDRNGRLAIQHAAMPSLPQGSLFESAEPEWVEVDLKRFAAGMGHGRGREPPGGDVQRHVPPVVDQRPVHHADLAHDLRPQLEGVAGRLPLVDGQRRPEEFTPEELLRLFEALGTTGAAPGAE